MAEKEKEKTQNQEKEKKPEAKEARGRPVERPREVVRIVGTDVPATLSLYAGLTKIKGISWALSNAVCYTLAFDKKRKVSTLTPEEIDKISVFIKDPKLPAWLLNRKRDIETGMPKHLIATELDLQREFDIRRMRRIRSYKGVRHSLGQPVRGQRTRSHFRKKGKAVGVTRVKAKPGAEAPKK
jgi:small subunit ribosomal protein S13